jgi:hypothetical protein
VDESVYSTDQDTGHAQGRKYKEIQVTQKQTHRENDRFFAASGADQSQHNLFHFRRAAFYSPSSDLRLQHPGLVKTTVLRHGINLNIDDAPIVSHIHTHPSHSQTSSLLSPSLCLGIPFPHSI